MQPVDRADSQVKDWLAGKKSISPPFNASRAQLQVSKKRPCGFPKRSGFLSASSPSSCLYQQPTSRDLEQSEIGFADMIPCIAAAGDLEHVGADSGGVVRV